jgi:hypothetical protein
MQGISGATPVEEYVDIHTSFDPYNGDIIATDRANGGALSMIKQNDGTYHIKGPRRLIQILGGRSEIGGDGGILSHIHDGKLYDL